MTFTKEQLIERARENVKSLKFASTQHAFEKAFPDIEIDIRLAEIALASLEDEPVAYIRDGFRADGVHFCGGIITAEEHERTKPALSDRYNWKHQPLYTAPPAPVVNGEYSDAYQGAREDLAIWKRRALEAEGHVRRLGQINDYLVKEAQGESRMGEPVIRDPAPISVRDVGGFRIFTQAGGVKVAVKDGKTKNHLFGMGWNACRAAMLQGAEPVTTANKLPANTPCKDAPEHIWLQTAGVWPENGEFSELTWCSDNQHPDDTLYVRADVVAGNSPAIPDGWVMVPADPTAEMLQSGISAHFERSQTQIHDRPAPGPMECAYVAMLAAAPQQEA